MELTLLGIWDLMLFRKKNGTQEPRITTKQMHIRFTTKPDMINLSGSKDPVEF